MARDTLGLLEFDVMSALAGRQRDAYGITIAQDVAAACGRTVSLSAIYTTLERLQRKGFVSSAWGESSAQRGGRRKRLYKVEAAGMAALSRSRSEFDRRGWSAAVRPVEG